MAAVKKGPASGGPGAGQVACGWPRRSRLEARDFPYVALWSSLAPIDKNAELYFVPCAARGYPPAGAINMPVQLEKLASAIGPGFDLERNQAESPPHDGRRNQRAPE